MKNKNYYMLAKTMFGLEEILAEELTQLGAQNIKILNRAVSFKGDKGFMYKANLNLRTALRILKPIKHFQTYNEKDLYTNVDIDIFDALLGTKIEVEHFENAITVKVPPLTQQDDVIRVKGKGMQLNDGTTGNLYIKLNYQIPKQLTDEQKELLEKVRSK